MVAKGLKKGDRFEEGGFFYVVDKVLDDGNYVSHILSDKENDVTTDKTDESGNRRKGRKQVNERG